MPCTRHINQYPSIRRVSLDLHLRYVHICTASGGKPDAPLSDTDVQACNEATHACMLPDWVLLILLFIGIAIVPAYDQARMMTPFEYFAGGLGALLESVGAFVGLILLAIALIVGGAVLLVGAEHVRAFVGGRQRATAQTQAATASSTSSEDTAVASKHDMRPYRVAQAKGVPRDDRLHGLVLVIAGLGLLWLIPSYLLKNSAPKAYQPPPTYSDTPSYSRKFSLSGSAPGQAVLGVMTLGILLAAFAFLAPEKQTQKTADELKGGKALR